MGRPPLPIGTYGAITVISMGTGYRARAKYRDYDGVTRPVERTGPTKAKARRRLTEALRDRVRVSTGGEITTDTLVTDVVIAWLDDIDASDRAIRTKVTYREVWHRCLQKALGRLRVRDMRVSRVDRMIRDIREHNGPGTAKQAQLILSGALGLAVRHDALEANPVRELTPARRKTKAPAIVLTEQSWSELRGYVHASELAHRYDLVDLLDVLSGLGCRIGELLALDWTKIDEHAATIAIEGTLIRIPKQGLVVQPHAKTKAGNRTIIPPDWVLDILTRRHAEAEGDWVFASSRGTLRDPDTTRKQLRDVVADSAWQGLHPHAFRHLVATRLDAAGLSAREIADYLGHERVSMTQDVYMSRRTVGGSVGSILTEIAPAETSEKGG